MCVSFFQEDKEGPHIFLPRIFQLEVAVIVQLEQLVQWVV